MEKAFTIGLLLMAIELSSHTVPSEEYKVLPVKEERKVFTVEKYKKRMGELESNHNYKAVNRLGYLGKYQFHPITLRRLDFTPVDVAHFLDSAALQELAMDRLIEANAAYIYRNEMDCYIGEDIKNTKVTYFGLLAASHLVGPYAVKRWLRSNGRITKADANGTSIEDYMEHFEDSLTI